MATRWMNLLVGQDVKMGFPVTLLEHGLQTATRALRSGADDETVICGLFHDIGEFLAPSCHGEIAASMLRPYISEKNYWILKHHEVFQAYYYGDQMNVDKNLRERFRNHRYFDDCEKFCGEWDETSFDADFESLPLTEFRGMLRDILMRKPYQVAEHQLEDAMTSRAKHDLSAAYTFDEWNANNGYKSKIL